MVHIIVIYTILAPKLDIFLVLILVDPLEKCSEYLFTVVFIIEFAAVLYAFVVYSLDLA